MCGSYAGSLEAAHHNGRLRVAMDREVPEQLSTRGRLVVMDYRYIDPYYNRIQHY